MKTVLIRDTDSEFIIGKIVCVGRNYLEHINELGNQLPSEPVIFMKPASSVIKNGETVFIPSFSNDCHYEAELAVLIGTDCKNISEADALSHIAGYGVAIDMTLRDVQDGQKKKGLPWDVAKGFDTACPLSDFVSVASVQNPQELTVQFFLNGEERQNCSTGYMIFSVAKLISYISTIFTLEEGDIILTGTPSGVGKVVPGDQMEAIVTGVGAIKAVVSN